MLSPFNSNKLKYIILTYIITIINFFFEKNALVMFWSKQRSTFLNRQFNLKKVADPGKGGVATTFWVDGLKVVV